MRNVAISIGVLVLALGIWVSTRRPLSIDEELDKLPQDERQALDAIASAAGITKTQLRPVGSGVLQYNPKAVAIQDGHVVELRVADAPIQQLDAVSRLVGLRVLWLDGCQLRSLQGIESLKALRSLNVSRTKLSGVAELRGLPKLEELNLSGNQISDVAALTELPVLTTIDLTGNPLKALPNPVPPRWKVKSEMAVTAPASAANQAKKPDNWVDKLPQPTVDLKLGSFSGVVTNKSWQVTGSVTLLNGIAKVDRIPGVEEIGGGDTTLELEVEKGQVRAYLESAIPDPSSWLGRKVGYIYVDAAPGKPGKLVGTLRSFGPGNYGVARAYEFTIESIGGEASGIRYKLYHR